MAELRDAGGDEVEELVGAEGGRPEGAISRPQGPASPIHVSMARLTLSPQRDFNRYVTERRFPQTVYDADAPYWGIEGARRSMDVETAMRRELDSLRGQLDRAMQMLTAVAADDQAAGNEAARLLLLAQGIPVPDNLRPGAPFDVAAAAVAQAAAVAAQEAAQGSPAVVPAGAGGDRDGDGGHPTHRHRPLRSHQQRWCNPPPDSSEASSGGARKTCSFPHPVAALHGRIPRDLSRR